MDNILDVIITGSGPCGLACGIEAKKKGFNYKILEKGSIANTIRRYPTNMTFFSTSDLLELDNIQFPTTSPNMRPTRQEAMEYYLKIVQYFNLNIQQHTTVTGIEKEKGLFRVSTSGQGTNYARNVILAIGYFEYPNKLGIPGEELPHVSHYYDEAYAYAGLNVAVVGGANSAAEAALDLYRHGVKVSLIHWRDELAKSVKYWVKPDLINRVSEGSIPAFWNTEVKKIEPGLIQVQNNQSGKTQQLSVDQVFLLTGYHPDGDFLEKAGIRIDEKLIPEFNDENSETNIRGLYVAGSMVCGCETANIFIENGRLHAKSIFRHITKRTGKWV